MNKIIAILFFIPLFFSCSEDKNDNIETEKKENKDNQTLEKMVDRHVQAQLSIPSTEKYSLQIYKEHLDGDDKLDAIITVNRLNFAYEEANKSGKYEMRKELGFTGHYNYIFYYDGGLNMISPSIIVPSSPQAELVVKFENISTSAFKDVLVDYKIRNSSFRNYYNIMNHSPVQVFQWKLYDYLGEKNVEANYIEYSNGSVGLARDILIYKGELKNRTKVKDIYKFSPEIEKDGELLHRFFYLDREGKYFTKK